MDKRALLQAVMARLEADLELFERAARTAHEAATHEENIPDNKYATLALEASYLAQGQANRAQQVRQALADFKGMECRPFEDDEEVRLGALVKLEDDNGNSRWIFLGPGAGGLKVALEGSEVTVVTPESPLGRGLLAKQVGDLVASGAGSGRREYEIARVC